MKISKIFIIIKNISKKIKNIPVGLLFLSIILIIPIVPLYRELIPTGDPNDIGISGCCIEESSYIVWFGLLDDNNKPIASNGFVKFQLYLGNNCTSINCTTTNQTSNKCIITNGTLQTDSFPNGIEKNETISLCTEIKYNASNRTNTNETTTKCTETNCTMYNCSGNNCTISSCIRTECSTTICTETNCTSIIIYETEYIEVSVYEFQKRTIHKGHSEHENIVYKFEIPISPTTDTKRWNYSLKIFFRTPDQETILEETIDIANCECLRELGNNSLTI